MDSTFALPPSVAKLCSPSDDGCVHCGEPSTRLCDAPVCDDCAVPGDGRTDFCRDHAPVLKAQAFGPFNLGHRLDGACLDCGRDFVLRFSKRLGHLFYFCAGFPQCGAGRGSLGSGHPAGEPVSRRKGGAI